MTQQGVEDFSQSTMPASKRPRTAKHSSLSAASKKSATKNKGGLWPLGGKMGPLFDPFPAKIRCVMRYNEAITLDPGASTVAPFLFRANSIFDPNFTGVGHQPYGHDTYASIYNEYRVTKSVITVTPASSCANLMFGISITDDSTINANFNTVKETKGTKMIVLGNQVTGTPVNLQQTYSRRGQLGGTDTSGDAAVFGTNPDKNSFFHVWATGNQLGSDPAAGQFNVNITYFVECWDIRDLGQS